MPVTAVNRRKTKPRMPVLKKLFWLYFVLLIFEGALRKWIVPQLSAPLLLVRDPIALYIIWEAYRTKKWPSEWSGVVGFLAAAMIALAFIQLLMGTNIWIVAVFGLRSFLLPFPVAFIMANNLDREDLLEFGRWTLLFMLPIVGLQVAQYYAPPTAFLNSGAGTGTEQLAYANGHVRASGPFSYVLGPASYIPLVAAFVFYGIVNKKFVRKWLLWASASALVVSIPVTGSRSLLIIVLLVVACVATAAFFGVSQFGLSLKAIGVFGVILLVASQLPVFRDASDTFTDRLTAASASEGGTSGTVNGRVLFPVLVTIQNALASGDWFGNGIGIGSNVGAALTNGGQFVGGEGEIERVVYEFGPIVGIAFLLFRFLLAAFIVFKALGRVRAGQPLAWLLVPPMLLALCTGTLEQPTVQGFAVVTLGFSLAALRMRDVIRMAPQSVSRRTWKPRTLEAAAR